MMIIDVVRGRNWRGKSLPVIVLFLGRRIDQISLSDPKLQVEGEEESESSLVTQGLTFSEFPLIIAERG